jgi:glycosyltransferase involved in cell wall biosynthesis
VAVSRALAEAAVRDGVPKERVHLLPNAWTGSQASHDRHSARRTLGLPRDGFVVGWVGRLIKVKGGDLFLRALATLPDMPLLATIIGDGPERMALESQAASLGLREGVRFAGQVDNAAHLFSAFDLFVLSSRSEGTPIALFEAMAAGVPIVATRVGGVPDVLSETEAYLVPPDDPGALSRAIRAVYSDPDEGRQRGARARGRLASDFAVEPWLECYEDIYRRIRR